MKKESPFYQREGLVYVFAIFASLLLSCWLSLRDNIINPDGICYLLSAQAIGQDGLRAAMQLCGQAAWPFFSLLVYALVQLTHCSYLSAANVLDGFFSLLSVVTFIAIVKQCGGSGKTLWLAAAVILLSHEFNSVREYVVRDHGFWAFYLISIYYLIRYFRQLSAGSSAIAWNISLIIATLFRIEGAIFLVTLPFLAWVMPFSFKKRFTAFLSLNLLTILTGIFIVVWLLIHPAHSLAQLGRLHEVWDQLHTITTNIADHLHTAKLAFAAHIVAPEAIHEAGLVLIATIIAWYVASIIINLSWPYGFLVIYSWFTRAANLPRVALLVLTGYLLVNVLITLTFLTEHFFLTKRYLMALSLVLMIWVPFALARLLQHNTNQRGRVLLVFITIAIGFSSLGGVVDFGYSKTYIREAGVWLAQHAASQEPVYSNSSQVMYYAQHFEEGFYKSTYPYHHIDISKTDDWKHYHYIALRIGKHDENPLLTKLENDHWQRVQAFANQRGDRVVIYKMPHLE